MKSLRYLLLTLTLSSSFSAFAAESIGSGAIIGPGGDSGFTGGGGPGGSTVGVGSGGVGVALDPGGYLPATGIALPSTPQFGINDIKIVGSNCVISKLGISIAMTAAGTNPCLKLYPQGAAGGAAGGTTGGLSGSTVGVGSGTLNTENSVN